MVTSPSQFAALLRRQRLAAGLTQEALAERAGLGNDGIQKLERGVTRPQRETVRRLVAALGLDGDVARPFWEATVAPRQSRSPEPPRHDLPVALTSFVGRERELAEITEALGRARLVTLTGAGGVGKTRLGLEAARAVAGRFPDGAHLAELASLADPALVPQVVAAALGIREPSGRPLLATLLAALGDRRLLLLLDNCEHLLDACAELVEALLLACPTLRVLATSRETLRVPGEVVWRVPSLTSPAVDAPPRPADLDRYEAVRLFVERAAAAQPGFTLSDRNAPAVAEICRRLDGLPLAIELAAARVTALPPEHLAVRLDQRFRLLTAGSRVALSRQQTLRAALDWSYDLMDQPERRLFARLAVFVGGWTLDAAEAVCSGNDAEQGQVLDILACLVEQSLVQTEEDADGTIRCRLLETTRQYGQEKLSLSGEANVISERHAAYYAVLAAAAVPKLQGSRQIEGLAQQEADDGNLRQALAWLIARGDGEAAARLAADRAWFWLFRSRLVEGREVLRRALAIQGAGPATRARALAWLSVFDEYAGGGKAERASARRTAEEALALALQSGDQAAEAFAYQCLGFASDDPMAQRQHYAAALARYVALDDRFGVAMMTLQNVTVAAAQGDELALDASLAEAGGLWRQLGHPWGLAEYYLTVGRRAARQGELGVAQAQLEEALRLRRDVGYRFGIATILLDLGRVAQARGDLVGARPLIEQALDDYRASGPPSMVPTALTELAGVLLGQGEHRQARHMLMEALRLAVAEKVPPEAVRALAVLTGIELLDGRPELALRRAGTVLAWRDELEDPRLYPFPQRRFERWVAQARAALPDAKADAALGVGRQLTLDRAAEEVLGSYLVTKDLGSIA